jgi:Protein of unknown function (DUF1592)/Protein of unknown function (DUF1588)/Protein of unknown function (DUF1595)/Protein of unknown function (DUF1585)/Protein of unknown function (DUF1587)
MMARRKQGHGPLLPLIVVGLLGVAGCVGVIGDLGGSPLEEQVESEVTVSGLRRLTAQEYTATVQDIVGFVPNNVRETLPIDPLLPFDNDFTFQKASEALIQGADLLAGDVAEAVVADPALRDKIVGCTPSGPMDATCYRSFIQTFGRRAFRRPLTTAEVDKFAGFLAHASISGDFYTAVDSALRAFLQHPAFLYRVEIGSPVPATPGVNKLDDYEVATRLSYLIIGSTPENWLLDEARDGKLATPEGLRAAAEKLFVQDRAKTRMSRFHELWLGYSTLTNTGISADMRTETDALISRVIFEDKRPWTDMLTSQETYLTPELATHYGLPSPGAGPGWVPYGDSGRKGILSQGTFLSAASKFGDTSPTQRGLLVRTRLFCQVIPKPPPELMVNVDMPPDSGDPNACKSERYFMTTTAGCKNCHALMDPIGFGLERYDAAGRYREAEPNRPECTIDGSGVFDGVGNFNGPSELADLMLKAGGVDNCVAEQLYRYAVGRTELDYRDHGLVDRLVDESSAQGGLRLDQFVLDFVTSDAIRYRREEPVK